MQFEHIVQVNDLSMEEMPVITRQQLWLGLKARARQPDRFVIGLEGFELFDDQGDRLNRRLYLPGLTVEDEVIFEPEHRVQYWVQPNEKVAGGSLTMTIEEPETNALFVRFSYFTHYDREALGDEAAYDAFVQQAYIAMDVETIALIRQDVLEAASPDIEQD